MQNLVFSCQSETENHATAGWALIGGSAIQDTIGSQHYTVRLAAIGFPGTVLKSVYRVEGRRGRVELKNASSL